METQTKKISRGIVAGVAGGLVGAFAMDQFQALAAKAQDAKPAENEEPATEKAAAAIMQDKAHYYLSDDEKRLAGTLVHYAMGGVTGGIYGAVAAFAPGSTAGFGTLFGAVVWLLADELAVPALGLSKKPSEYPLATHAMALASHLVYGLSTEGTRRAVTAAL